MRYSAANALMAAAPRKRRRETSGIDRFQPVHDVSAAPLVTGARALAGDVEIDADPTLKVNGFENAVAGGEVDIAVAEIVNVFAAEGDVGSDAAFGVFVVHHHQPGFV